MSKYFLITYQYSLEITKNLHCKFQRTWPTLRILRWYLFSSSDITSQRTQVFVYWRN